MPRVLGDSLGGERFLVGEVSLQARNNPPRNDVGATTLSGRTYLGINHRDSVKGFITHTYQANGSNTKPMVPTAPMPSQWLQCQTNGSNGFNATPMAPSSSDSCHRVGRAPLEQIHLLPAKMRRVQEYFAHKKLPPPQDPTVGLCPGPYGVPRMRHFIVSEVPLYLRRSSDGAPSAKAIAPRSRAHARLYSGPGAQTLCEGREFVSVRPRRFHPLQGLNENESEPRPSKHCRDQPCCEEFEA